MLLLARHLGERAPVAVVGHEHAVVAEAAHCPVGRRRSRPSHTPSANSSRPSGHTTIATVRKRARRSVGVGRARRAAWPSSPRRCALARRTWPCRRPGAPPRAATSSPVSSATAGQLGGRGDRRRLEPGVAHQRAGVLDHVGHVVGRGQQLDARRRGCLRSRPPCRVGRRADEPRPAARRRSPSPRRGGSATISACRSTISVSPRLGEAEQLVELGARERPRPRRCPGPRRTRARRRRPGGA